MTLCLFANKLCASTATAIAIDATSRRAIHSPDRGNALLDTLPRASTHDAAERTLH